MIAGVLAAVALALGFVTLAMNQSASHAASPKVIVPFKDRHKSAAATTKVASAKIAPAKTAEAAKPKPAKPKVDPNFAAAVAAGLPADIAHGLAAAPVVVVQLTSVSDPVAQLADAEAKSAAQLEGAAYVEVSIDHDGGAVEKLTRLLGTLPDAPASLFYVRPGTSPVTLQGFNDRTVVEQAIVDALASLPPKPAAKPSSIPSGVTAA
ncbi:MAG TPA: hypothetical protein VGL90_11145 [Casimicrobiaceae bacterium]